MDTSEGEKRKAGLGRWGDGVMGRWGDAVMGRWGDGETGRSVSLSWGGKEVGSPCEWRGGARHCSRAMVGCRGPAPAVPGYSKERRVEEGLSRAFPG